MIQKENPLATRFLKHINKIIDYKLKSVSSVESAIIDQINDNGTVNLHIPPDKTVFTNIQNQSIYHNLQVGDCVKVLKQNNKTSNMWVIGGHKLNFVDSIYPIGSIYMSVNDINPSVLFGGKWDRIQNKFLLAASDTYPVESTGGETEHQLTVEELPEFQPTLNWANSANITNPNNPITTNVDMSVLVGDGFNNNQTPVEVEANTGRGQIHEAFSRIGNNQPHNNMPPYFAVYMWKRTL